MQITTVQSKITKTAAYAPSGGADVSAIPQTGWVWKLRISSLSSGASVRFALSGSVDGFTTEAFAKIHGFSGKIDPAADVTVSLTSKGFPVSVVGVASGALRINLLSIAGSNASVTYESWVESNQ